VEKPESTKFLAIAALAEDDALRDLQKRRFARMGEALVRSGFSFAYREVGSGSLARGDVVAALHEEKPDLVFCSFYDRRIYDSFAREKVLFVGSSADALELCLSKSSLKRVWESRDLASPSSFCVRRTRTGAVAGRWLIGRARDFPYIVKPDGQDENRGIHARSIAFDADALVASIDSALEEYDELLVEHFVGGAFCREYTVAMIGNGEGALMLPAEIVLKGSRPIRVVTREDRERGLAVAVPVGGAEGMRIGAFARKALEAAGLDPDQYVAAIALSALSRGAQAGLCAAGIPAKARELLFVAVFERLVS
jgi:hypothetical protein